MATQGYPLDWSSVLSGDGRVHGAVGVADGLRPDRRSLAFGGSSGGCGGGESQCGCNGESGCGGSCAGRTQAVDPIAPAGAPEGRADAPGYVSAELSPTTHPAPHQSAHFTLDNWRGPASAKSSTLHMGRPGSQLARRPRFADISRARVFGDRLLSDILESRPTRAPTILSIGSSIPETSASRSSSASRVRAVSGEPSDSGRRPVFGESSGCCDNGTITVGRGSYNELSNKCSIFLGSIANYFRAGLAEDIEANVDSCFAAVSSEEQVFRDFLPEWFASMSGMRPSDLSNFKVGQPEQAYGGLFWGNYYRRATQYALCTLYGAADCVDLLSGFFATPCRSSASVLRETIEDRAYRVDIDPNFDDIPGWCRNTEVEISVDAAGQVRASRVFDGQIWGITPNKVVHLCNAWEVNAMLADYYFHWASRLHAKALREGSYWDYWVGMLCARCGLAEIVELAGIICHETHHMMGSYFHCHSLLGRQRYFCCQFGLEFLFRNFMWAEHGLPRAHLVDIARDESDTYGSGDNATERFASNDSWSQTLLGGGSCVGMTVGSVHDSLLDIRHRFTLSTTIPKDCTYGSNSTESWVVND